MKSSVIADKSKGTEMLPSWDAEEDVRDLQKCKCKNDEKEEIPCYFMALSDDGQPLFQWRVTTTPIEPILQPIMLKQVIEPYFESSTDIIVKHRALEDCSLIITREDDLTFCYFFKGNHKRAQIRMSKLIDKIKQNKPTWKGLVRSARHRVVMGRWEIAFLRKITTALFST